MSYKTILVSLNEIDQLGKLLEASLASALSDSAHIIGLYVIPGPTMYPAMAPYTMPEIFDEVTRYFEEHSPRIEKRLRRP